MALETPYLAAENSAVERRSRALNRFLVGSPILLLIAVGLVAHIPKAPYNHPAGNPLYDQRVLAYQPRVVAVQELDVRGEDTPTDAVVREAQAWADGYASGELKPIESAVYEDHFRDGVRGDIVRCGLDVAGAVAQRADLVNEADAKARITLLSCETAFGLRGFDLQAHLQTMLLIRRNLATLIKLWPSLPKATKDALRPRVQKLATEPSEIDRLTEIEQEQLTDYVKRQKIKAADVAMNPASGQGISDEEAAAAKRGVTSSNGRLKTLLETP